MKKSKGDRLEWEDASQFISTGKIFKKVEPTQYALVNKSGDSFGVIKYTPQGYRICPSDVVELYPEETKETVILDNNYKWIAEDEIED